LRDGIAEKMSEKMHISNSVAISMFPYLEIMFQNDELAWEISDFLDLEKDEIKRFRKKVIPKKVINKMEKQKEEMRIEERDRRASELQSQMLGGIPQEEIVEEETIPDEVELISKDSEVEKEDLTDEFKPINQDNEVEEELMAEEIIEEEVEEKSKEKKNKQASLFDF
jgi:replication factor C large subunit